MTMTPEARRALSDRIRGLRHRLVVQIDNAVDRKWRFSLPADELPETDRLSRERFEDLVRERMRSHGHKTFDLARAEIVKLAAATRLNRVVFLRILEVTAPPHRKSSRIVTGFKKSPGYAEFLSYIGPLAQGSQFGYDDLLRVACNELALDLPGLYGRGVADLVPFPPDAMNDLLEAANDPALDSCWTDDTTPGWIYQYWNDPDREALDKKIADGGKIAPHEIASKTQMFTERYMVEWLLHNSLGPIWLRMCRREGWTADVVRSGVLDELDHRRADWRGMRERGEVALDALMLLESDAERRWAYYVPQPLPDGDEGLPESIRGLRMLDPACGSGHFLVIAFDLLVALYEEEARHRGETWSRQEIVASVLENNLHGIDLDPRAVQIAAAALWVKAQQAAPGVRPARMNLVAADLGLQKLKPDDPARKRLMQQIQTDTGMPTILLDGIWSALAEVDTAGSLLKVGDGLRETIESASAEFFRPDARTNQGKLFAPDDERFGKVRLTRQDALSRVHARVEDFLAAHTGSDDLGLRLSGEQLAAGLRFLELVREGTYQIVIGNPPYQGTAKMVNAAYIQRTYPKGKADLYAAFIARALQLCVPGGISALLTMRNWMFITQYITLRDWLLKENDIRILGDFAVGAFEDVPNDLLSVVGSVVRKAAPGLTGVGIQPSDPEVPEYDRERTKRKRAAVLSQVGRYNFRICDFELVPGHPLLYWWDKHFQFYSEYGVLGDSAHVKQGLSTANNARFLRSVWEMARTDVAMHRSPQGGNLFTSQHRWMPYIKGAAGKVWIEPLQDVVRWAPVGLEIQIAPGSAWRNESFQLRLGVSFPRVGATFSARMHRYRSAFDSEAATVFHSDPTYALCVLNSTFARFVLASLNPSVHFQVGDVGRLPRHPIDSSSVIVARLESAFSIHESHREPSVEFCKPGASPWLHTQQWAQLAVDRPSGAPLPPYAEVLLTESPSDHLSYAIGVALGRFRPGGTGTLDPAMADLEHALPNGTLFLDGATENDDLDGPESKVVLDAWKIHGPTIAKSSDARGLRSWLRTDFFSFHKKMYENRPIHWPLSSSNRTFVAWVNIHRMGSQTLTAVLARVDAALLRLRGRLHDLRGTRDGSDAGASKTAGQQLAQVAKYLAEAEAFVADLRSLASKGPPSPNGVPAREVDAPYAPDLDDGVMINSSALWPLLEPQWKDPKKWWAELAKAEGRKDYDWSHLAMRYWPTRVDAKCQEDPSLGVAHGCFWRYHPMKAYAWELRLQDEIGPDFLIQEKDSDVCRVRFLREHPDEAHAIREKEAKRRERKQAKDMQAGLFGASDGAEGDDGVEADA